MSEIIIFIKNHKAEEFNHKKLKKRICRIVNKEQMKTSLII